MIYFYFLRNELYRYEMRRPVVVDDAARNGVQALNVTPIVNQLPFDLK